MKKASRKNNVPRGSLSSRLTENLSPTTTIHGGGGGGGGVMVAPPPPNYPPPSLYFSCPPLLPNQQPPLLPLPLPISKPRFYSFPSNHNTTTPSRGSPTATPKKTHRSSARDQSLTPRKSSKRSTKASQEPKTNTKAVVSSPTLPVGSDPSDLPKDVSMVLSPSSSFTSVGVGDKLKFEGLIWSCEMMISPPPPSSLPLPKFSMRPKKLNTISCTAEAASVDDGATDNLIRLLRLR